MNLIPLKKEQFPCLRPLIEARIIDGNMATHTNVDHILSQLGLTYDARCGGAYTDSIEAPSCFLIMGHFPGVLSPDVMAIVSGVYVSKEKRGDLHVASALVQAAEAYARANGASSVVGASWIYRGADSMDSLWLRHGFEPREHTFIKHLT